MSDRLRCPGTVECLPTAGSEETTVSIALPPARRARHGEVDWADDHVVCGSAIRRVLDRFTVAHDAAGLKRMAARLLKAAARVGIERDGPVVAALLAAAGRS
jgi:hypothetical protein